MSPAREKLTMRRVRAVRSVIAASSALWLGCGGSGGGSTSTQTSPTPATSGTVTGTVVDSLTARPLSGVAINIDGIGTVTSAVDGTFTLATTTVAQPHMTTLSSDSTVQRMTHLNAPGPAATLAFERPPLNRTPDIDPNPFTSNLMRAGPLVWRGEK